MAKKKMLAPVNGSVMNEPLIPVALDQIMVPMLHMILSILKGKIWDELVDDIHLLDCSNSTTMKTVVQACNNLLGHVAQLCNEQEKNPMELD